MSRKVLWTMISILAILAMSLLSCSTSSTTSTATQSQTATGSSTLVSSQTTSSVETTGAPPTTTKANWWDKFGTPQYGGTITQRQASLSPNFDNYTWFFNELNYYWEPIFARVNWTTDRKDWPFTVDFTPENYCTGVIAESYEIPDLQTVVVHVRQGIHFQDKPPVNGRELTADDLQIHYDRILGTGSGYTSPAPMYGMFTENWDKVTATDKYTVVYKFKQASANNLQAIIEPISLNLIEPPEWVALAPPPDSGAGAAPPPPPGGGGDGGGPGGPPPAAEETALTDWRNGVGSGAWILTDYVDGSAMTFSRNLNYWAYDERYPQNKLPYADTLKVTSIPDTATSLAALRTGKIDLLSVDWRQKENLDKSNPDLQWGETPGGGPGIQFRCDVKPFTDINVRIAMQMAVDLKSLAKSVYGGTIDGTPVGFVSPALVGYAYDYKDWPQSLKDEYSYNPEGAKKLLADAGYPNGFKTNVITSDATSEALQAIKAYLLDINVDMEIKPLDWAQYGNYVSTGKHDQMCTQGVAMAWPPSRNLPQYDSRNPENSSFNNSAEYDALMDKYRAATTAQEIMDINRACDKLFIEQHWEIVTFATVGYSAWQSWLKGFSGETQLAWGGEYVWARLFVDQSLKK